MSETPTWPDRLILETLHADQILEHGGSLGIRDEGLLESALARPQQKWHYEPNTDLSTLAAACAFGVAKNHPFIDGNKRAALVAAYTLLAINGFELESTETEAVGIVLGLADGSLTEEDLAAWIRSHLIPWVD
ncbi:MAG TPA: type II toxin-antitoxin system death-on-curing family toxin [Longimicrobiales bacterium]|nr:type II toxin-antitoxin system death-on-curing family toxin [Longimicrobiales bacterium]